MVGGGSAVGKTAFAEPKLGLQVIFVLEWGVRNTLMLGIKSDAELVGLFGFDIYEHDGSISTSNIELCQTGYIIICTAVQM